MNIESSRKLAEPALFEFQPVYVAFKDFVPINVA